MLQNFGNISPKDCVLEPTDTTTPLKCRPPEIPLYSSFFSLIFQRFLSHVTNFFEFEFLKF